MLQQQQSQLWWKANPRTLLYFIRELTGFVIAAFSIYFLYYAFTQGISIQETFPASRTFIFITLLAAIIHTLTWLFVSVKLSPVPLTKTLQWGAFIILVFVWLGLSYFLLHFLYLQP